MTVNIQSGPASGAAKNSVQALVHGNEQQLAQGVADMAVRLRQLGYQVVIATRVANEMHPEEHQKYLQWGAMYAALRGLPKVQAAVAATANTKMRNARKQFAKLILEKWAKDGLPSCPSPSNVDAPIKQYRGRFYENSAVTVRRVRRWVLEQRPTAKTLEHLGVLAGQDLGMSAINCQRILHSFTPPDEYQWLSAHYAAGDVTGQAWERVYAPLVWEEFEEAENFEAICHAVASQVGGHRRIVRRAAERWASPEEKNKILARWKHLKL